ncbi:MAG: ADP-ribosylglycohydrolase family protein [Bacteroidales bacterium]|nr:ADP-ribosylglycohydrolase family protein [Bacteroidales bacterium]
MKNRLILPLVLLLTACTSAPKVPYGQSVKMDDATLMDKIRGGWYGQTIGCTYGGPTEFKYKGGIIMEEIPIPWYDDYIYDTYIEDPGLYDDVYMDLTFMETMLEYGIDAPADKYAEAFATADYKLWHANQAARYNILNGRGAPESGHWMYNPHADDIDFQIEADFIGMLYPGQINKASELSDRIGHIMNYGDGWYGGVYIGAMYCLAYVCNDIPTVVTEALRTIPEGTKFHSTISDVIKYWKQYPDDWKQCWFCVTNRHANDVGCPEGVWNGFNIDATINSAFVVIGLLYGDGDLHKTMDIATRCGNDSDCNPASAAGILGVMYGYDAIPDEWKKGADRIKDIPFPYTNLSLEDVCKANFDLVKKVSQKCENEGDDCIYIELETPQSVRWEQSFEGIVPVEKRVLKKAFSDSVDLEFKGNSIVVEGSVRKTGHADDSYVADVTALLDGAEVENFKMPIDYITRKYEIFSKYCFESGAHTLTLRLNNPNPDYELYASEMVVYDKE